MTRPHPASLILLWLALLVAISVRSGAALMLACLALGAFALVHAGAHLQRLLRRSRWLLLTLFIVFVWMTPGTPLPFMPGASAEGLHLAIEHIAHLLLALATLALILQALTPVELVAGMHSLLAPLCWLGVSRNRIAVRLMLTLEEAEREVGQTRGVQGRFCIPCGQIQKVAAVSADVLHLPQAGMGASDAALGLASCALLATLWLP